LGSKFAVGAKRVMSLFLSLIGNRHVAVLALSDKNEDMGLP
jgi:hypothetical protein